MYVYVYTCIYLYMMHSLCLVSILCCIYSIQKVLTSSTEEVDVLVKTYQSTSQLASFLVVLRRDYIQCSEGQQVCREGGEGQARSGDHLPQEKGTVHSNCMREL